jgi:peptide/nickel transport system permease protein
VHVAGRTLVEIEMEKDVMAEPIAAGDAMAGASGGLDLGAGRPHGRWARRVVWLRPLNLVGLLLVLGVAATSLLGLLVTPYSPVAPDYTATLRPPSLEHLLGTDEIGRDVLSRILSGAHLSLEIAVVVVAIGAAVGTMLGLIAGYAGGWTDELLMRLSDIFLAFPALVLAMAIAATLGPSIGHTMLALTVLWWPWYARLIRGQVLSLRERQYVEAAHAVGVPPSGVIWRHLLPNTLTPLLVQVSLDVGFAILAASSLSFIGLGVQPPTPDWGLMVADAQSYVRSAWWVGTFPGLAIMLAVLGFNLLGDTLNDILSH